MKGIPIIANGNQAQIFDSMTYNFVEPEFPDAPKLVQFGLTAKDYEDLAEVDKAIKSAAWYIPAPVNINWGPMIGGFPTIAFTILFLYSQLNLKSLSSTYRWYYFIPFALILLVLRPVFENWESKYQSQRERRFAERMAAWRRRVRARAPSQVQYRDTLQPLVEIFETAHANYYRELATPLVIRKLSSENAHEQIRAPIARRIAALEGAYGRALKHYRTPQPSLDDILSTVGKK